jgi:hypothetical protein
MTRTHLFSDHELRSYLERSRHALITEIDQLPADTIVGTDIDALTTYFVEKYTLTTPVLDEQHISVDQVEMQIDVSQDPRRMILDRSRPFYITGTRVTHYVPFTGNADLFSLRPSYYSSRFPTATITGNELAFIDDDTSHDATSMQAAFADALNETKKLLAWCDNDVQPYNNALPAAARERLTLRHDKLTKDQQLVQTLGYPLRQRENAPRTYTLPTVRKKLALPAPRPPAPAEPALDMTVYDNILTIIQNMALVLERSPNTFRDMQEEDLRTHFLVQLNGQYDGQASG